MGPENSYLTWVGNSQECLGAAGSRQSEAQPQNHDAQPQNQEAQRQNHEAQPQNDEAQPRDDEAQPPKPVPWRGCARVQGWGAKPRTLARPPLKVAQRDP